MTEKPKAASVSPARVPPARSPSSRFPGGPDRRAKLDEMIRVDHAGEYGAVRIYEGQLAVLKHAPHLRRLRERIEHMAADEERHLDTFNRLVSERGVRPTALNPLWHAAGFALGAATALMGEKAALACTAAVEEVIDEHYRDQIDTLERMGEDETPLKETIETFRQEELAHREEALEQGAAEAPGYGLLSGAIKAGCRAAIAVAKKV